LHLAATAVEVVVVQAIWRTGAARSSAPRSNTSAMAAALTLGVWSPCGSPTVAMAAAS
jgi:hypothetical protein